MKPSPDLSHRANHGFTLIELLVGTAITALIVLSLNMVLYNATQLRDKSYESRKNNFALHNALTLLKKDLQNAIAPNGGISQGILGEDNDTSTQSMDRIQVYTTTGDMVEEQPWGDIQRVTYELREMQEVNQVRQLYLVRSVTRNLLTTIEEEPDYEPILRNVYSLSIRYYDGENWVETWDSSELAESNEQTGTNVQTASSGDTTSPMPEAIHIEILLNKNMPERSSRDQEYETVLLTVPLHAASYTFETASDEEDEGEDQPADEEEQEDNGESGDGGPSGGEQPGGGDQPGGDRGGRGRRGGFQPPGNGGGGGERR